MSEQTAHDILNDHVKQAAPVTASVMKRAIDEYSELVRAYEALVAGQTGGQSDLLGRVLQVLRDLDVTLEVFQRTISVARNRIGEITTTGSAEAGRAGGQSTWNEAAAPTIDR